MLKLYIYGYLNGCIRADAASREAFIMLTCFLVSTSPFITTGRSFILDRSSWRLANGFR
ncbi:hypothetical protein [Rhizobium terrae]|uniref:hypothetical protein n=1 Tax=Rhizobium terrae TaxID=2171756 RepID=UPI00196812A7|nr:hypothetical protein [Rhizobium terrae]